MYVLIIGTNHRYQVLGCQEGKQEVFEQYLRAVIHKHGIQAIAEELNEEAFPVWRGHDSTARVLAASLGIKHMFCDPTNIERERLGIPTVEQIKVKLGFGKFLTSQEYQEVVEEQQKYWLQRESYWIKCVKTLDCDKCVFILGLSHVQSFAKLLLKEHVQSEVIHENWKP
jgi:hypothetical protein